MKKIALKLSALALLAVVATSCAQVPQAELDAAQAALEAAKQVEANRYLPTEFNALQDSINAAMVAIEAEKSQFFLTRSYSEIAAKLTAIVPQAEALKAQTEERKAQVRTEVQESLASLTALIEENKGLVAKAPRGKGDRAALEAIQNDIAVLEASVGEVNTLVANGDYLTAQDKVNASLAKAESIKTELSDAIAKARRR